MREDGSDAPTQQVFSWLRHAERDHGKRPGLTTDERELDPRLRLTAKRLLFTSARA